MENESNDIETVRNSRGYTSLDAEDSHAFPITSATILF